MVPECPPGREPWRYDRTGAPLPLFVPAELVEQYRKELPRMWIEATPFIPYNRALTLADWKGAQA